MNISSFFLRLRSQELWSDPERKIQTLESFSQTEIDAGENILRALKYANDPNLRTHLQRHAEDELRHGELFKMRAQELRELLPNIPGISKRPDKLYRLSRVHEDPEYNSHGFFTSDNFEKLGEIMYVAMLNIEEKRAEESFVVHCNLNKNDPDTHAIFEKILKDEHYHVSYTGKFLQQWRKEGRSSEVSKAIVFSKRSQFVNTLIRAGSRFGEHVGHTILYCVYFTIIIPFALMSNLSCPAKGWNVPNPKLDADHHIRSQY